MITKNLRPTSKIEGVREKPNRYLHYVKNVTYITLSVLDRFTATLGGQELGYMVIGTT